MEKPIEKGSFVQHTGHPEYGVGRVVNAGTFATRVLFAQGGLRVYRVDEASKLRVSAAPAAEALAALDAKEALLVRGALAPAAPKAAKPEKPKKAKKTASAAP